MKILSLDSGQKNQSFCLAELDVDNEAKDQSHKILTTNSFEGKSSELIENIKKHFITAKQNVNEVNLLAVNLGPGSFTGIRNALSIVKTLSLELEIPVFTVNSFDLLRFEHKLKADESICIPAFKGNFFISEISDKLTPTDDKNISQTIIKNEYFSFSNPLNRVYEYIRENTSELIIEYLITQIKLAKTSLLEMSDIIDYVDIENLEPYYLREPSVGKKC